MREEKNKRHRERIFASVIPNDAGCWIWQKSKYRNGYGRFAIGGGIVILARLKSGEAKASIARSFSVTDRVIFLIARGQLWKHIERVL